MKTLCMALFVMLFTTSLMAASEVEMKTERFIGAEQVYKFISVPHDEFWNKHCLAFQLRRNDNTDFRVAVGYRINEVEKTLVFNPTGTGKFRYYYRMKYFYVNHEGQPVETIEFKCLLPDEHELLRN